MLTLSRALVKSFRLVARRAMPSGRPRGPAPPVRISAEKGVITLAAHLVDVVVSVQTLCDPEHSGSMILSMNDLERFEGSGPELVTLETNSEDRGRASWQVRDIPAATEFHLVETKLEWPEVPKHLTLMPSTFTQALHEAGRSSAVERTKYALDRIQIRGKQGQIIGTDSHQFLVQGGFEFPFVEELLVPAVPVFGSKEFVRLSPVSVGLDDQWFNVDISRWRIWLKRDTEGRFPDVFAAIPKAPGASVLFDDHDVETLLEVLSTLPRETEGASPVTLDLGEQVALRVRPSEQGDVIEIPLAKSGRVGPDMQVVLNREHLGRALSLGFREFRVSSPERPICARDEHRVFVSMLLDPSSAIQRAKRTAGAMVPIDASPSTAVSSLSISPLSTRRIPVPVRETPSPERNGVADVPTDASFDPLAEAEALRVALADAATRVARLVGWLKQFRKERRALASAYSSLRQLNLSP